MDSRSLTFFNNHFLKIDQSKFWINDIKSGYDIILATYSAHKRNDDVTHLPPPTHTHHLYPPPHIQRQPSFCQSRVQYILPLHKRTFSDILSDLVDDSLSATVHHVRKRLSLQLYIIPVATPINSVWSVSSKHFISVPSATKNKLGVALFLEIACFCFLRMSTIWEDHDD